MEEQVRENWQKAGVTPARIARLSDVDARTARKFLNGQSVRQDIQTRLLATITNLLSSTSAA